jgi:hypothetical protein
MCSRIRNSLRVYKNIQSRLPFELALLSPLLEQVNSKKVSEALVKLFERHIKGEIIARVKE